MQEEKGGVKESWAEMNSAQQLREERKNRARAILRHPQFVNSTTARQGAILQQLVDRGLDRGDLVELQMEAVDAPEINFRTTISDLTRDPLFLVMRNLSAGDVSRLCSTDRKFREFCTKHSTALWDYMIDRDYPERKPFTPYLEKFYKTKGAKEYYKLVSAPPKMVNFPAKIYDSLTGSKLQNIIGVIGFSAATFGPEATLKLAHQLHRIYPPIFPGDTLWLNPFMYILRWDGKKFTADMLSQTPDVLTLPTAIIDRIEVNTRI